MLRSEMLNRVAEHEKIWDLVVIGGGATGVGCALDAAARGLSVLLVEQSDFGKGTSSRSTKLIHGGVRYLAQGNIGLVKEALRERSILLRNAPHLVRKQGFIVPAYSYWDKFFYGTGLKTYNILAGRAGFGRSRLLSKAETVRRLPNVRRENLEGGIIYFDGQFDDARLLVALARTAVREGACLLNYARVFSLHKDRSGKIDGVAFSDEITGQVFLARAASVINATGAFADSVRRFSDRNAPALVTPSQGIHLVFERRFLPEEDALMVPKTSDGRVLFAIPWNGRALFGTTDTPVESASLEPKALEEEIEFILTTAADYLTESPSRSDIRSVFAGIRPLVRSDSKDSTASLARDHSIETDASGLISVTGGKWTTYRRMAADAVDRAVLAAGLRATRCRTAKLRIDDSETAETGAIVAADRALGEPLHPEFPYSRADVVRAVRSEMAQTVEDVLARRLRILFLDAAAAVEAAPETARLAARELGRDEAWIEEQVRAFSELAAGYRAG